MSFLDDYEPVEDRLRAFWSEHPEGRIATELISQARQPGDVILFKASAWRDQRYTIETVGSVSVETGPDATGYAHQRLLEAPPTGRNGRPNESAPEWTSPWEVAETSAIGRALANLGYAAKGRRPSREEISKASASPTAPPAVTRDAHEQVSSEPSIPADAEGAAQVSDLSLPAAAPTSSAAPEATGTSGGEDRGTAESSAAGADASGEGRDPNLPTSRREQLWKQLVEFSGTKRKALNAVNTTMKASWTEGHIADIPEDDLEHALKALLRREGIA